MQAVAVGAGSPCLVPTARRRCRHPGAISEIADLSLSLSPPAPPLSLLFSLLLYRSLPAHFAAGFFKVRPREICVLFVAKPNKVSIDNINATFAMWTRAIIIRSLFASSSHNPVCDSVIPSVSICIVLRASTLLRITPWTCPYYCY